jgi:hypothetical protein
MRKGMTNLLIIQGVYCLLTGLWPLIHISSFMVVTGPKTDLWLVKTVSLLIVCIALSLLKGSSEKHNTIAINMLAITMALSLLFIDLFYSLRGVISKIYLADGVIQFIFLVSWGFYLLKRPLSITRF